MPLSETERLRYSRHLLLGEVGLEGQQRLRAARVLIVGAGGLGSPAALYLTAAGVGRIGLIDGDHVDLSNLQRQILFDSASIGAPKAETARRRLLQLNPEIEVIAHAEELRAANAAQLLAQYDLVLDGSDRLTTRYLVNDACVLHRKPLVSAAVHRFEGQAMSYVPGQGPCYRCLFSSNSEGLVPNCAEAGVLGVLPGVMGTLQATEAIKLITGIGTPLVGRLLTYDALELRFREFRFARRDDCAVCGDHPTITTLQDAPELCAADIAGLQQYTAAQLQQLLGDPRRAAELCLIDVRDASEYASGHLRQSCNIPLAELSTRLMEFRGPGQPVFVCLSGIRSLRACALAVAGGIQRPGHLIGGLRLWTGPLAT